jgi:hypothetical protein
MRGGRVATNIPATGMKEATKVSMLKNPRPEICSRRGERVEGTVRW